MFTIMGVSPNAALISMAVASGLGCILIGLISNYPVSVTPGVAVVAILPYTIFISMGKSLEVALAAVFVSSVLFLLILGSNLREKFMKLIPIHIQLVTVSGIGFLVAFIGLKYAGVIVANPNTLVAFGDITSPVVILAIIGLLITIFLHIKKVPASFLVSLIITAAIGLIMTFLGFGSGMSLMPSIPSNIIITNFDFSLFGIFINGFYGLFSDPFNMVLMLFTILILMIFDVSGCLIAFSNLCGFVNKETNEIKNIKEAFIGVGLSGIIAAICGTGNLIISVECVSGIMEGGRTGLTAVVTGILFLCSIIITPLIISLFTPAVTCSLLVMIGIFMMAQMKDIDWDDFTIVAPVFISIIITILSFSITWGIISALIIYFFIQIVLKFSKTDKT